MRHDLYKQVDTSLSQHGALLQREPRAAFRGFDVYATDFVMLVSPSGQRANDVSLPIDNRIKQVAAGKRAGYFRTTKVQGYHLRELVVPLPPAFGGAVVVARNIDDIDKELSRLRLILLLVSLGGVGVAALAGALVSRTTLAPVRRLTSAAERIARTRDPSERVPEGGRGEIARLGASFNTMATSLEQLFDARRQLVAWASHDLRAPVSAIRAMLEAIEDGLAEPADYLESLADQTSTLGMLIDDLFELAQIDAGALTLELRETPVGELVVSCVRGLEAEARARRVQIEVALAEPLPVVACAAPQVQRVLLNLLTNALRHTPADGSVVVTARSAGPELQVLVEDTGDGLSEQAQARMFDRFWRADTARTRSEGGRAGLGLAIAQGLIEAQGGRVWAENRPTGGALVGFSLPLTTGQSV
jgi:signal transduction histidine kinase